MISDNLVGSVQVIRGGNGLFTHHCIPGLSGRPALNLYLFCSDPRPVPPLGDHGGMFGGRYVLPLAPPFWYGPIKMTRLNDFSNGRMVECVDFMFARMQELNTDFPNVNIQQM